MKVIASIDAYEIDGSEKFCPDELVLESHRSGDELVVVRPKGGPAIAVKRADLARAVETV